MNTAISDTPPFDVPAPPPPPQQPTLEAFVFSGRGSEYFRIWIVNLLLSIITLGIYSAWAKVRRTRYFYDNTKVAGSSFEYHGNPIAILKGRIIAVVLIGGYQIAFRMSPKLGLLALALMLAVMPWLIWRSYQFKLFNSSYRGIRFGFKGSAGKSYFIYLLLPLISAFSLGLLSPFAYQRNKKYLHTESKFGATHFSFDASVGSFYQVFLICFAIAVIGYIGIGILFSGSLMAIASAGAGKHASPAAYAGPIFTMIFTMYAWTFLIVPLALTMVQNLIWNHTRLADHQFQSKLKWTRVAFIMITNLIAIVCTLGLFTPFAQIRSLKYRLESVSLLAAGSLDHFLADAEPQGSAAGEGMSDLLDFDLSL